MKEKQQKTIKNIGLAISIFSGFMIFSNGMGALTFKMLNTENEIEPTAFQDTDPMLLMFTHFNELVFGMLSLGIAFLIGGLYLRKMKLWANRLVSIIAGILFFVFWSIMISLAVTSMQETGMDFFSIMSIVTAIFWTTPLVLLVWYLNKKEIKENFA